MIHISTVVGAKPTTIISMRTVNGIGVTDEQVTFEPGSGGVLDSIKLDSSVVIYITRKQTKSLFTAMARTCEKGCGKEDA